jgi:hypothetical protein
LYQLFFGLKNDPLSPEVLELLMDPGLLRPGAAPDCPNAIPSQTTVLELSQFGKRHEEDAFLGPAGLGSDGEDLCG